MFPPVSEIALRSVATFPRSIPTEKPQRRIRSGHLRGDNGWTEELYRYVDSWGILDVIRGSETDKQLGML